MYDHTLAELYKFRDGISGISNSYIQMK